MASRRISFEIALFGALGAYSASAWWLNFTQDDAYITYRYVANFLNGHGLVYNVAERVEGFTNFGWLIYLACWGSFGVDYLLVSKVTGFLLGGGMIVLTYLVARHLFKEGPGGLALLPLLLVGLNQSLAYWSPAGLETAAFGFFTQLSVYAYLRRSRWLVWGLLLAAWIRPEGAVVAAALIVTEWFSSRTFPAFTVRCAAVALAVSLPLVAFRLFYYGDLLPNPFFAKTDFGGEQLLAGLSYLGQFLAHYGFLGAPLLVPMLFYRKLSRLERDVLTFTVLYVLYVVLIGGDVLKVHRFFVPVFGLMAALAAVSVRLLTAPLRSRTRRSVLPAVVLALLVWTVAVPRPTIIAYNTREKRFVQVMKEMARNLKSADSSQFSVAISTIGAFGFNLLDHDVIDLLGLTDSTIARHPEAPVEGMETTWRERKHNTRYVLKRAPDYLLFSTGMKPSSPAEQTLLLYPSFRESYRAIGWVTHADAGPVATLGIAFKKVRRVEPAGEPDLAAAFVSNYAAGLEQYGRNDFRSALGYFERARALSVGSCYPELLAEMGFCEMVLGQDERAIERLSEALSCDSSVYKAHEMLYRYRVRSGQIDLARVHERWLRQTVPALWPWIEIRRGSS